MRRWLISALGLVLLAGCSKSGEHADESDGNVGVAAQAVQGTATNSSNFNGTAISAGSTLWFSSVMKLTGQGNNPAHLYFNGSHIAFTANGQPYDVPVPSSVVTIDPASTTASTTFNTALGRWEIVLPSTWSGDALLGAVELPVAVSLPGGINPVSWSANFQSDVPGLTVSWKWGAAVYTQLSTDYNALQVKPVDGSSLSIYHNADHPGTPEAFKAFVVGGARGGGGSNFTGSWSNTVSVNPTVTLCATVVCTALDACHDAGTCDPSTGVCSNPAKPDGTACNDGNSCTQTDTCQSGACTGTNLVACTALDSCHDPGTCDSSTGVCSNPAKPDGTACNDDNACTQVDTCQSGTCTGTDLVVCAALDACHDPGTCDSSTGVCSNPAKPDGTACNDDNACTQVDTCQSGTCTGASPVVCVPAAQCQEPGVCDPANGLCSFANKPDGTACNDGNACTQVDTCQSGACSGASPVVCTALDPCHDPGVCDTATGACSNPAKADGTACSDGNACTQVDTCQSGSCTGASPVVCTALDPCHVPGVCDVATGTCSNPPKADGTPCNDGNACTTSDVCGSGTCTGGPPPDCDDGNVCTTDGCSPAGGCTHANNTSPCDDLDACTTNDTCSGGLCFGGPAPSCDDGNPCTTDACNNQTGCYSAALVDGSPCPGGLCQGGSCSLGPACPSTCCQGHGQPGCSDQAIANCVCAQDPTCCTGQWSAACAALVTSLGCGTCSDPCDDGDVCTADLCSVAGCSHQAVSCSDGVACTADSCAGGTGCQHVVACPPGAPCSSNFCASALGQSPAWAWLCQ